MSRLVSAVVPSYNYGRFVSRAIESVFAQTFPHIECIVVDDGSTDETEAVLAPYAGRVRLIRKAHQGVSSARNAALAVARGDFVAFLDGDDWWHPRKIEQQLRLLDARPEVGCVGCGLEHVYPDGRVERIVGRPNPHDQNETLRRIALREFWIYGSCSGAVVRREVLDRVGRFDEGLIAAEDWDLWLRVAAATVVDNVPEVLVSINRHGQGVFRNARLMETNQFLVYDKIARNFPGALGRADKRRLRALILADAARESRVRAEAMSYYMRSLSAWPFHYGRTRSAAVLTVRTVQAALHGRTAGGQS